MAGSLQDQLLKAGLANKKQAKQAKDHKRKQAKQKRAGQASIELIETHRVPLPRESDLRYNFVHGTTIRHLYLEQKQIDQLARGQLRIAVLDDQYHLIPAEIVERIETRQQDVVLPRPQEEKPDPDDPYADYQIPDDLMW